MRHCKSSWDHPELGDHQRPLNRRGKRDAPKVGSKLRSMGLVPDCVVSSDSQRTIMSWSGVQSTLGAGCEPLFTNDLYHAGANDLRLVIEGQSCESQTLLVLGHNPGWEYFASWLAGSRHAMTTGNVAVFSADTDSWKLEPSDWVLVEWLRPREL